MERAALLPVDLFVQTDAEGPVVTQPMMEVQSVTVSDQRKQATQAAKAGGASVRLTALGDEGSAPLG